MIDLTPLEVRKKRGDFRKGMRGYDPEEVDQFLEAVADRLEALVKENLELKERTSRLAEKVEAQGARESAVREALVTAQELREEIRGQARREAEVAVREARTSAEARLHEARSEAERVLREAKREAESLLHDAERESERRVDSAREAARRTREDAEGALEDRRRELRALSRARTRFLLAWRTLLERELDALEVAEDEAPENRFPAKVLDGGIADLAGDDGGPAARTPPSPRSEPRVEPRPRPEPEPGSAAEPEPRSRTEPDAAVLDPTPWTPSGADGDEGKEKRE